MTATLPRLSLVRGWRRWRARRARHLRALVDVDPVAVCAACGGYLEERGPGRYVAVAACPECWTPVGGLDPDGCHDPARHCRCASGDAAPPEVVTCAHGGCGRPAAPGGSCGRGGERCCGCCWTE